MGQSNVALTLTHDNDTHIGGARLVFTYASAPVQIPPCRMHAHISLVWHGVCGDRAESECELSSGIAIASTLCFIVMSSLLLPYLTLRSVIPVGIALFGYVGRLLTLSGSVMAVCIGSVIVEAGWDVAGMIILFFVLGSGATKIKQKDKEAAMPFPETKEEEERRMKQMNGNGEGVPSTTPSAQKRRHGRDWTQVCATGLLPAIICATRLYFPAHSSASIASGNLVSPTIRPYWYVAYLAYVSCCCGDTLASELGMLAKQTPISILRRRQVMRGVDGGVTLLGTCASILGGMLVGLCGGSWYDVYAGGIYGCVGAAIDSIMGSMWQQEAAQKAIIRNNMLEKQQNQPVQQDDLMTAGGWKLLNNVVNFASSTLTAVLAMSVQYIYLRTSIDLIPVLSLFCILLLLALVPRLKSRHAIACAALLTCAWSYVWSSGVSGHVNRAAAVVLIALFAAWRSTAAVVAAG